ncbi:MAG: hypothetical protein B6D64_11930 [Bacteroidetes bacterium 4484_276]|nr:MAG: hypothetical protein B6D64_11930 [Bacteroidetes bacterium 4484_276]
MIILKIVGLEQKFDDLLNVLSFCGLVLTGTSLIFKLCGLQEGDLLYFRIRKSMLQFYYVILQDICKYQQKKK